MAVVSGTAAAVLVWSPGAFAAAGCTTTTSSIGQTIVCNAAGTESITVPDGAYAIDVVIIGGGGGGGGGGNPVETAIAGGNGGAGARVEASLVVSGGTLSVTVGDGGSAGSGVHLGGGGGGLSQIVQGSTIYVIAGGGGGGGFADTASDGGDGAADNTASGGNGGGTSNAGGGLGGASSSGGLGGQRGSVDAGQNGENGSSYPAGTGGAGKTLGGNGGSGFGGGGGGAWYSSNRGGGGAGGSYVNPDLEIIPATATYAPATGPEGLGGSGDPDGTSSTSADAGTAGYISIRFYVRSAIAASSPTARTVNLDFSLPASVRCNFDSVEASLGSWIELPSASDCTITPRDGGEDPSLLGWATQEDFSVEIAQRQVDNGWGAYETYGNDGQLTGVFIPAGGYTAVTNDTNLYPIWSE